MLIVPAPPTAAASQQAEPQLELLDSPELDPLEPLPGAQPMAPPVHQPVQRRAPVKKKKTSSGFSWAITGSIIGVAVIVFAGALFYFYQKQASELSSKRGGVRSGGRQVDMGALKARAEQVKNAPPPKEPVANMFDTGSRVFVDPSVQGSDTELTMPELIKLVEPSIVRIKVLSTDGSEGIGSGCFIDKEGKIVTNFHVVGGAAKVTVSTADGKSTESVGYISKVRGKDLAIIQVDPADLNIVPIAIATRVPEKGEKVAAFGAPQGFDFTATNGIVSGIRTGEEIHNTLLEMNRNMEYVEKKYEVDTNWIQTTAAISGGNSGGPLVNMKGEMVGVNTWTHRGGQNLNFAAAVSEVGNVFMARESQLKPYFNLPIGYRESE